MHKTKYKMQYMKMFFNTKWQSSHPIANIGSWKCDERKSQWRPVPSRNLKFPPHWNSPYSLSYRNLTVSLHYTALFAGWRYEQILPAGEGMIHCRQNQSWKSQRRQKMVHQVLAKQEMLSWKATGTFVCPASRNSSSSKHSKRKRFVLFAGVM